MKAQLFFLAALAVLSAACQREPLPKRAPRLMATVEMPTKGFYDDDGTFYWHHGDALSFWSDWGFFQGGFYEGEDGTLDGFFSIDTLSMKNARTLCLYPHIPDQPYDEDTKILSLCIPEQHNWEWNDRMLMPLAGFLTTKDGDFYTELKHIGGAVLVTLRNLPLGPKAIVLTSDKRISGFFPVDLNKLGTDACKAVADNKKEEDRRKD